jgi:hypothetical protein
VDAGPVCLMASRRYLQVRGKHSLMPLRPALAEAWGGAPERQVAWLLFLRLGRCA